VKVTVPAERQMMAISDYISYNLYNPDAAYKLMDEFEKQISSLSEFPHRIGLTEEEPWRSEGVHRMVVGKYYVYFWIDEAIKKVQVTGVVYAPRNQREQLAKMTME
jgi:toxin ParE1/3/4